MVEKILNDWKKGIYKPIYWLEGEEPYYIDQLVNYAEEHLLLAAEKDFNQTIFYGKDADWVSVINACRRHPMFAEKQLVILKEAQQMRDIDKLESYIENPLATTIFIVAYKEKKVDGRSKLAKTLKQKGEVLTTKKMYDTDLPNWVNQMVQQKGLTIKQKALMLLVDHIGNDLNRLQNEVDKLAVNLSGRKEITENDIEEYIGISKEFNVFELQDAVVKKNLSKAVRIIQYFEANPKAAPIQMILPALYNFFSKVFMMNTLNTTDERTVAAALGIHGYFAKDYITAYKNYQFEGAEKILLLLHEYNLKSIGINNPGATDAELLKEMVGKIIL